MYIRGLKHNSQWWLPEDPELFVKFFKRNTEHYFNTTNPNLLLVSFDHFVNDYDSVSVKIMDFLGLKESDHIKKKMYFNPEISINNTKLWKDFSDQKAIHYIKDNLVDYCYN